MVFSFQNHVKRTKKKTANSIPALSGQSEPVYMYVVRLLSFFTRKSAPVEKSRHSWKRLHNCGGQKEKEGVQKSKAEVIVSAVEN